MRITYFGTTMLLFDDGQDQLLFDCHITRPSMLRYLLGKLQTDAALADELIERFRLNRQIRMRLKDRRAVYILPNMFLYNYYHNFHHMSYYMFLYN